MEEMYYICSNKNIHKTNKMNQIILIIIFFITIAYLIYLGNKENPMSISAAEDIKKMNNESYSKRRY